MADGHIFHIKGSNGAAANIGRRVVEAAGDNNAMTIIEDNWTNEASKVYQWTTYDTSTSVVLKAGAADASAITVYFGDKGRRFPNLMCETIDGGTLYFYMLRA